MWFYIICDNETGDTVDVFDTLAEAEDAWRKMARRSKMWIKA